jgi:hypothetical protein
VELTALPTLPDECWLPDLQAADAVLVAGGNSGYLSYWFHESGFADCLPTLGSDTVYVGVSAGSCVLTPALNHDQRHLAETGVFYDDEYDEAAPAGAGAARGLGLVDFHLRPHLNSADFGVDLGSEAMERVAAKVTGPLYAIDDQTAITVVEGVVDVISEGQWRLFNASGRPTSDHPAAGDTETTTAGPGPMTAQSREPALSSVISSSPAVPTGESVYVFPVPTLESMGPGDLAMIQDATEVTIVTSSPTRIAAARARQEGIEGPFAVIRLEISQSFGAPGFVAHATGACARAGINVFVLSTYSFDYVLVPEPDLPGALSALAAAGFPTPSGASTAAESASPRE